MGDSTNRQTPRYSDTTQLRSLGNGNASATSKFGIPNTLRRQALRRRSPERQRRRADLREFIRFSAIINGDALYRLGIAGRGKY